MKIECRWKQPATLRELSHTSTNTILPLHIALRTVCSILWLRSNRFPIAGGRAESMALANSSSAASIYRRLSNHEKVVEIARGLHGAQRWPSVAAGDEVRIVRAIMPMETFGHQVGIVTRVDCYSDLDTVLVVTTPTHSQRTRMSGAPTECSIRHLALE